LGEERWGGGAIEWHPSQDTLRTWGLISLPMFFAGIAVYGLVASRGSIPSGLGFDIASLLVVAVTSLAVFVIHEAVHGFVMALFGARPRFGVMMLGGSVLGAAFYTTAPGHVFSRRQYLAVIVAPTVLVSVGGVAACLSSFAVYAWLPFAIHLTGCVGDLDIARRTYRQPSGTGCEDLRDGVRFWPQAGSGR
jgi:hypothetical protein